MDQESQQQLNSKLADAADNGNLKEVVALLEAGANVNGVHCVDGCRHTPLIKAASKGYASIVTLLLEKGADAAMMGSEKKTAIEMAREAGKAEVALRIKTFEENKRPDRVYFSSEIGDRVRQDIYDFTLRERVTLFRKCDFGDIEAAVVKGFSEIEDQSDTSMLRRAFNEHVRRGGATDEAAVFTRQIHKAKPGLGLKN